MKVKCVKNIFNIKYTITAIEDIQLLLIFNTLTIYYYILFSFTLTLINVNVKIIKICSKIFKILNILK